MPDALPSLARRALAAAVVLGVVAGSFGVAMTRENPNENMYVAAGVLLGQGQALYADFAYLQTPLLPHVYRGLYALTGPEHVLLKAKILNWLFWLAAAGLLAGLVWRITRDAALSLALGAVFVVNFHVVRILWEASNYVLPMALSLAAIALLLRAGEGRSRSVELFASGVLAGLATSTKLYYAAAALPLLIAAGFARGGGARPRLGRGLAAMLAGLAVGTLPILVYLLADPERFWFDNVRFHQLVTEWYALFGYARAMDASGKLAWIGAEVLARPSSLALGVLAVAAALAGARGRRPPVASHALALGLSLFALTAVVACLPTPSWPQFFAMPVPYLLLAIAALAGGATPRGRRALLGLCALGVVVSLPASGLLAGVPQSTRSQDWVSGRYRAQAHWIAEQLGPEVNGPVATLQPLRVIEAGLDIYPEFATGPFLFAVGHALTPEERERFVAPSRNALHETFRGAPPAAVLVGLYGTAWGGNRLEDWARQHGYRPVPSPPGQEGTLYLRPSGP